jgi:hypothetical protein
LTQQFNKCLLMFVSKAGYALDLLQNRALKHNTADVMRMGTSGFLERELEQT